ncbi:MAG TPA: mycothiol synthase [Ornithinibacter sp.]|nr:mycothiol synthase [Ornithinibacter sp.]
MARTARVPDVDLATAGLLHDLFARAEEVDRVEAISEAFRLAVGPAREGVVHILRYAGDGTVVGYGQVAGAGTTAAGTAAVAELVVDPSHRRQGHGRALLEAVLADGAHSVWAHGLLPAAEALARSAGLVMTRSLYRMARPLTADDAVDPALPAGFSVRAFEPGRDDETWVGLNAAAFASHPEQGRLTLEDLYERMAQPWFDPEGLLLVEDDETGRVVAFHWTKIEPTHAATPRPRTGRAHGSGEVYVVGVHPAYQGRGLGAPLTRLGLAHLARRGLAAVELYVDGDNAAARRTYERLGFVDVAVDGQYTRAGT